MSLTSIHPTLKSARPTTSMHMTQAATPVTAAKAPSISNHAILPVQSGALPHPTGLPHGIPAHQFLMYGKTS